MFHLFLTVLRVSLKLYLFTIQLQVLNKRKSDVENMLRQKAEKILEDREVSIIGLIFLLFLCDFMTESEDLLTCFSNFSYKLLSPVFRC